MRKQKCKVDIFAIALLLLVLTLITSCMTTAIFGKYKATTTGQALTRVARFDVSMGGSSAETIPIDGIENNPVAVYPFTITSNSEVSVDADLTFTLSQALPNGVTVALYNVPNSTELIPCNISGPVNSGGAMIYSAKRFATFSPVAASTVQSFVLIFTGPAHGGLTVSKDIQVNLSVTMSQVD